MSVLINCSGITFLDKDVTDKMLKDEIRAGLSCYVSQLGDKTKVFDGDYAVCHRGQKIGWIPQPNTLMKYLNKANRTKDNVEYKKQEERLRLVEHIRGMVSTDIHTNECIIPKGQIAQILFRDDRGYFHEKGESKTDRKVASVSILFEYPYP